MEKWNTGILGLDCMALFQHSNIPFRQHKTDVVKSYILSIY
jgi:hypothetical protein